MGSLYNPREIGVSAVNNRTCNWFKLESNQADGSATVWIYDVIGDDVLAAPLCKEIDSLDRPITLRVNSPGGNVFQGLAIYNSLKAHKHPVTAYIDGLAASAASVIVMSAARVLMPENTMVMIHDPSGLTWGGAEKHRSTAAVLDQLKDGVIGAYQQKSGLPREEIQRLMSKETWLSAQDAVELGFADEVIDDIQIAASFDLSGFKNPPTQLRVDAKAIDPKSFRQSIETQCNLLDVAEAENFGHRLWESSGEARTEFRQQSALVAYCRLVAAAPPVTASSGSVATPTDFTQQLAGVDSADAGKIAAKVWSESKEARAEFGSIDVFSAYCRAVANGQIR